MRVLLVGHDFDFSAGDGISRYSYELCKGLAKHVDIETMAIGRTPRPMRVLFRNTVMGGGYDIVHLMYPDAALVRKEDAKLAVTWHDLRPFDKYTPQGQSRYNPAFFERFQAANRFVIQKWLVKNYFDSDAILCNSSQTLKEVKERFFGTGANVGKKFFVTPLGVNQAFLKSKVWKGKRKDFAYVGSIHLRHKNLQGLLSVFDKVAKKSDSNLHLFTSSPNADALLEEQMKNFENISEDNVILHRKATDQQIARYLPKLAAYLQLTLNEGQGIPILEALASGTNVVTLKNGAIPEEIKKCSIQVAENNAAALLLKMARNPKPAPQGAIKYARGFTWERMVKQTLEAYRGVLSR